MHRLLQRQLRRHLGRDGGFDPPLAELFAAIDEAYRAFDQDRELLERSLELTSEELCRRYDEVRKELERRERAERELARASAAAERANLAKSRFLASMSHEIRTPLHSLLTMLDLVLDGPLDDAQRRLLEDGRRAGDLLLELVNGILDLARIESGRLELARAPFSLREALESVGKGLAPVAFAKGVEFVLEIEPGLADRRLGDALRLQQVLINLAGNAIKFTEEGAVCIEATAAGEDRVGFAVRDTGIGIPAGELHRIFEAFEQAHDSDSARAGGTGLGLAISLRLVQHMGGAIEVESEEGRGSLFRFSVELPLAEPGEPERRLAHVPLVGRRIAVRVERPELQRALERMLRGLGAEPPAGDRPDAVIADVPARANASSSLPDGVPVLWLKAHGARNGLARGHPRPVETKPILDTRLAEALLRLLGKYTGREAPAVRASAPAPGAPLRVLFVEDNDVNRRLGSLLLRRMGAVVVEADSGESALEHLAQSAFDLVLMDVQLPGIDGLETTRRLRRREAGSPRRTRVVALTAQAFAEDRERCLAAGMDGYLTKPFRREDLAAVLRQARRAGSIPDRGACPQADPTSPTG